MATADPEATNASETDEAPDPVTSPPEPVVEVMTQAEGYLKYDPPISSRPKYDDKAVSTVLKKLADYSKKPVSQLKEACREGYDYGVIETILGSTDYEERQNGNPLYWAIRGRSRAHNQCVMALLDGAKVDIKKKTLPEFRPHLQKAIQYEYFDGYEELIAILLKNGAVVGEVSDGDTPLSVLILRTEPHPKHLDDDGPRTRQEPRTPGTGRNGANLPDDAPLTDQELRILGMLLKRLKGDTKGIIDRPFKDTEGKDTEKNPLNVSVSREDDVAVCMLLEAGAKQLTHNGDAVVLKKIIDAMGRHRRRPEKRIRILHLLARNMRLNGGALASQALDTALSRAVEVLSPVAVEILLSYGASVVQKRVSGTGGALNALDTYNEEFRKHNNSWNTRQKTASDEIRKFLQEAKKKDMRQLDSHPLEDWPGDAAETE